jgi:hypothetical protein
VKKKSRGVARMNTGFARNCRYYHPFSWVALWGATLFLIAHGADFRPQTNKGVFNEQPAFIYLYLKRYDSSDGFLLTPVFMRVCGWWIRWHETLNGYIVWSIQSDLAIKSVE